MPARGPKIRVMIADDHAILRAGLRMLVDAQADMEVVSEASDGEKAIQTARETKPDVALLDLTMPRVGGMKALEKLAKDCPETRVLVLTMHDDPAYLRSALAAGASGYLLKRAVDAELLAAIRAVHSGRRYLTASVISTLSAQLPTPDLSERETQVLRLIVDGLSNKQIAFELKIAEDTAKNHVKHILKKLGAVDRTQAATWAIQRGIIHLQD